MTPSPWPRRVEDLLLREATAADLDAVHALRSDPRVVRFMVRTTVSAEESRREWLGTADDPDDFSCVVERAGRVVALAFLERVDGVGQPGHPTRTEATIGYVVDPDAWGQRIASRVVPALVDAAFDDLGVRRVRAAAFADNPASVRALERAGLRLERRSVAALWHAELGWVDEVGLALLAEERTGERAPKPG